MRRALAFLLFSLVAAPAFGQAAACSPYTLCGGGGGGGTGTGDVVGPASAVDERVCRFDTPTGKLIMSSLIGITDAGAIATAAGTNLSLSATAPTAAAGASQAGKTAALAASNPR